MSKKQGGTREGMRYRGLRYGEGKERVRVRTMGRGSRDNGGTEGGGGRESDYNTYTDFSGGS